MSKRGQEGNLGEGNPGESSAMAKPRSLNLVMAKPRPANLIPHNVLTMKKNSAQELGDSNNPGDAQTRQGSVSLSTGKLVRDTDQNPAEHSQVWKQESTQTAKSWKQEKKSESSQSTSTSKVVRGVDSHTNRLETGFRYMENPKSSFFRDGLPMVAKEVGNHRKFIKNLRPTI